MILWSAATCCSTTDCSKLIKLYQEVVLFPRMLIPSLYGSAAQILASIAICNSTCPKLPQFAATEASVRWEPLLTLFSMQNCTCVPIFMLCSSFAGSALICQLREGAIWSTAWPVLTLVSMTKRVNGSPDGWGTKQERARYQNVPSMKAHWNLNTSYDTANDLKNSFRHVVSAKVPNHSLCCPGPVSPSIPSKGQIICQATLLLQFLSPIGL